jgi:hypothetical protein
MTNPTPEPAPRPDVAAMASIDLGNSGGDETVGQAAGRRIGGLVLMLVAGVLAIACVVVFFAGWFVPALADWVDFLGDGLLWAAAVLFILAALGFELLRRGRKLRGQPQKPATALMGALDIVDKLDGADDPEPFVRIVDEQAPGGPAAPNKPRTDPMETRL